MEVYHPPVEEPATPEYVLAVLQDEYRQQCQFDPEVESGASLTFDTTVAEWCDACARVDIGAQRRALNRRWRFDCSDREWEAVVLPPHKRRLADVCRLVAARGRRLRIRPAPLLGCTGRAGGAFLTVRSMLRQAGARADEISPSTPLAGYTRRYFELFVGPVSHLAPGALPPVRVSNPLGSVGGWSFLAGFVGLLVGFCFSCPGLVVLAAVAVLVGSSLTWCVGGRPEAVEFGGLRTFRDLAVAIATAEGGGPA